MEAKPTLSANKDEGPLEIRARLAASAHRPRYHFLPPNNWMNDPNGFIEWQGVYHLFYQHNPHAPAWGSIHWGHATSKDLVYWQDEPIALIPDPNGPDADGCFSGCAVDGGGVPTLIYTGFRSGEQTQCIATGDPSLRHWYSHPANPVLVGAPPGMRASDFRDPFVWREGEWWYMLLASALETGGGAALLYRSKNLTDWDYRGPLLTGKIEETGELWECPNFFPLGDRHALIVSVWPRAHVHAFVGHYQNERFVVTWQGRLDHHGAFYAPLTTQDSLGRRLMVGWLDECCGPAARQEAGWAGVLSLPQIIEPHSDGGLAVRPVPEVAKLRGRAQHFSDLRVDSRLELPLRSDSFEAHLEFSAKGAAEVGLAVRVSPDATEETRIVVRLDEGALLIDRSRSSSLEGADRSPHGGSLGSQTSDKVLLHVFVDRSVIEVFVNDRQHFATRVYPSPGSDGIALLASSPTEVTVLNLWELGTIW